MQALHPAYLFGAHSLHHSGRQIGKEGGGTVETTQAGVAAVDMCPAVFSAEDCPLAEYRQTLQGVRSVAARHSIGQDPVIEGQIDTVMVSVKGNRFHGGLLRLENQSCHFHRFHRPHRLLRQKILFCIFRRPSCTWGS